MHTRLFKSYQKVRRHLFPPAVLRRIEISLAVPADLTIIDGRQAFVAGGPHEGKKVPGDAVLFGSNPARVDAEAYRRPYLLKTQLRCREGLPMDPFTTNNSSMRSVSALRQTNRNLLCVFY